MIKMASMKNRLGSWTALVAMSGVLLQPFAAFAQTAPLVTAQPNPGADVSPYLIDPKQDPTLPEAEMAALLRDKITYVFVIFNENHSFDNEFGTFPGVNGLYSTGQAPRAAADTPGFTQTYTDANGTQVTVQPFLIGPQQNATFVDSVDHSHKGLATKLNANNNIPAMDKFAQDEYSAHAKPGNSASQAQGAQYARLVMSHIDCDTIPFFWQYASRFTIFDNIFATEDTPSTPNAIAMIAGQSGETQWVEHGPDGTTQPYNRTILTAKGAVPYVGTGTTQGVPVVNDPQPFWGSEFDTTTDNPQPSSPNENYTPKNVSTNLTFASVPLTLMGSSVKATTAQDRDPANDLADIGQDIDTIAKGGAPVAWRWYQNGYDAEPNDALKLSNQVNLPHENYVSHHQGAQYFGYLANNPALRDNFRGEGDFFSDMSAKNLPPGGGVFYIRGGYYNITGQTPPIQNSHYPNRAGLTPGDIATINASKAGDDDHPGYTDRQLSEAMAARVINAVATDPAIWSQSAIIITYDESDGFYDHVPPRILSYGPDGLPVARGIRIPMIVISPYARTHVVSHAEGDHNAVIETLNAIFNLPPLSSLPNEAAALAAGNSPAFNRFGPAGFEQKYLGPRDTNSPITDSLLSAFSPARLRGTAPMLPASLAAIPENVVNTLPHDHGDGCNVIGIIPEDRRQGITNTIPAGFNTLPGTLPAYN
jgi:phospholipase C